VDKELDELKKADSEGEEYSSMYELNKYVFDK